MSACGVDTCTYLTKLIAMDNKGHDRVAFPAGLWLDVPMTTPTPLRCEHGWFARVCIGGLMWIEHALSERRNQRHDGRKQK